MELTTLIPLLITIFVIFFVIMRYVSGARAWNLIAILCLIALTFYFEESVVMIIALVTTILWLIVDTFFTK